MSTDPRRKHWPDPWVPPKSELPDSIQGQEVLTLLRWMESIVEWGKNVRDDIIRLESSAGLAAGDPGDPAPTPWRPGDDDEG